MRMSCNGCRVLRKGCSQSCSIRPCLQWIKSPESQANATVFLAKFYGRAGLINLINAGPHHLRPAIFRSLLYEACGRIANPIYGSVGLMWSGNWNLCEAAVEAVLKGVPITPVSTDAAAVAPPIKGYDIRHVVKDQHDEMSSGSEVSKELLRVSKIRSRFKRAGPAKAKGDKMAALAEAVAEMAAANSPPMVEADSARQWEAELRGSSPSQDSSLSHGETTESVVSVQTAEAAAMERGDTPEVVVAPTMRDEEEEEEAELELELDLRLGFGFEVASKSRLVCRKEASRLLAA